MRISDWSSDVCSSDLAPTLDAPIPAETPEAPNRVTSTDGLGDRVSYPDDTAPAGTPPASPPAAPPAAEPAAEPAAPPELVPEGPAEQALKAPQNLTGLEKADRLQAEMRTIDERSEEHTSELQSLMRTSYAAF